MSVYKKTPSMRSLGICFGSSTLQAVELAAEGENTHIVSTSRVVHDGNPGRAFDDYLNGASVGHTDRIAITGRSFRKAVALTAISEPRALEAALLAYYHQKKFPDAVISSGGETQLVYRLTATGGIAAVRSGNKCASGSGEFFLQQIRRIGLSIDEAVHLAARGTPCKIAGRCSVFCKSDCTHALNKGEPRENVVAGLCRMMADRIVDLVKDAEVRSVAMIGGGALNSALVGMLRKRFDRVDLPEPIGSFEAYGAALWALRHRTIPLPADRKKLLIAIPHSFGEHAPLACAAELVEFGNTARGVVHPGDDCILGLDVGSTTTKAVLMRSSDQAVVAAVYLRTGGDPILASRNCYRVIRDQIAGVDVAIRGLGVTGSGRQIAALHALTDSVVNEIIAHATAAAHFAPDVDTIFEIGGQDAKYTYLTNGVPSDYAMNEACSAGTGSFLEEAARESLNVPTEAIADGALRGAHPPNFTDQCAAFIGSDIKLAGQEGIGRDDILAGLVYSVCLNYLNRVKGARPVGKKIFMQGGVCYNKAVPLAMASLMKCRIIVPPDPGLMGAFGVALETLQRITRGETAAVRVDLDALIERDAVRESSFVCLGGAEKCDRGCVIARLRLDGKLYPFGGACNRYYNVRLQHDVDTSELDLVAVRENMLLREYGAAAGPTHSGGKTVGIMRSFLTHTLFPLYSHFFSRLGFRVVLADEIDPEGIGKTESAFCLPVEIAHGSFQRLLKLKTDFIFVPQVMQIPVPNVPTYSRTCVFVQGEPYYLKTTFREEIARGGVAILAPVLRMDVSYEVGEAAMTALAPDLGVTEKEVSDAYAFACTRQQAFDEALIAAGRKALEKLDAEQDRIGIVLFGRPYNSFTGDANMGIPHKFASRGTLLIPFDMLPAASYNVNRKMFWANGQKIMKSAQFVKDRRNLFGCFITNFSCGPDSFLLGFFREVMGEKPSLTLELDQHTADAGIDTRIEAALAIMTSYFRNNAAVPRSDTFRAAKVMFESGIQVITSHGRKLPLIHPDVEVVLPSMGQYATEPVAAVLRSIGINARALPPSDKEVLLQGHSCTSCKECLPYILLTGQFMQYIRQRENAWKTTLFFLPTGGGPCRLGQYCVALDQLIEREKIENAAILTLTDENGYGGFGSNVLLRSWQAIVVSDVLSDIRSVLSVAAKDRAAALASLESIRQELMSWFEGKLSVRLSTLLATIALRLKEIPLRCRVEDLPVISLIGEIFVRRDEFSRKNIVDYLEGNGFVVRVAPVMEYMCYSNYVVNTGLGERQFTFSEKMRMQLVARIQEWWEHRIKSLLAQSGLYRFEMVDVGETIGGVKHLLSEHFRGETILTVGLGMREILHDSCGVVSIGPFGCMPSRMAESMLKKEMTPEGKARMPGWAKRAKQYAETGSFPFLSIETDGSPFPQLVEANLEAFVVQAHRLHERMVEIHQRRTSRQIWRHLPVTLYELVLGNRRARSRKLPSP